MEEATALSLAEAVEARERIFAKANQRAVVRTPLVKLNMEFDDGRQIYLKLENLQQISSFKIRGAMNAILCKELPKLKANGVVTASAGNMGQGVAYGAKQLGFACKVVVPDSAPDTKLQAMERLGAAIVKVPYAEWWEVLMTPDVLVHKHGIAGEFIHPVCDRTVMAGHASIALETVEDLGDDLDAVLIAYGGGGLTCGIASVEPETACPVHDAFRNGKAPDPNSSERFRASFVDGCGGKTVIPAMWPLVSSLVDDALSVEIPKVESAIKLMAERNRFIAEGAGAVALAAAMEPDDARFSGKKKIVCIVCGGALNTHKLVKILEGSGGADAEEGATTAKRKRG